jgi:hypothetical protein
MTAPPELDCAMAHLTYSPGSSPNRLHPNRKLASPRINGAKASNLTDAEKKFRSSFGRRM